MKPSTIITRLLFNKLNRSVARDENARAREAKQAAEQAVHDEARANFLNWCEQVGDEHPLVVQVVTELNKVSDRLTLTEATKAKRYNAIFTNAWSRAEAEYGAAVSAPRASNNAKGFLHTIKPLVVAVGIILGVASLVGISKNPAATTPAAIATVAKPAAQTSTPEPEVRKAVAVTLPTPEREVRKAVAVTLPRPEPEVRKAVAVTTAEPPVAYKSDKSEEELKYTISSTGKRHNSNCRYYGKGRSVSDRRRGVACKICGG
jgi:hypothetical protein